MAKVVISVFGTAGDVLPCLSVGRALRNDGHQVSFLTPRMPGLYVREAGFRSMSAGKGAERRALGDSSMYTTKFDGLESWRTTFVRYVLPRLEDHYPDFLALLRNEDPDLVISTSHGFCGSVGAVELGKPWVSFHFYPDLYEIWHSRRGRTDRPPWRFALQLSHWLSDQERRLGLPPSSLPVLDWGVSPTRIVGPHDPSVLDSSDVGLASLGFPYDDSVFALGPSLDRAVEFLDGSNSPSVVVSLGSFIGLVDERFWEEMASAVSGLDYRFLLAGVPPQKRDDVNRHNVLATEHLPLSALLAHADLLIHHGGIGTTYAALFAGVPALISPRAFDQSFNCGLVSRLGFGARLPESPADYPEAITAMVEDDATAGRTRSAAAKLVRPEAAAAAIARRLVEGILPDG